MKFKLLNIIFLVSLFYSCGTKKPVVLEENLLYDIILRKDLGGAKFQFYEIISEEKEFKMIANDAFIKPYLKKEEFKEANFILVNLGIKEQSGYQIKIEKIEEKKDKIILKITEIAPNTSTSSPEELFTPNFVIRIKSKKPIEILP